MDNPEEHLKLEIESNQNQKVPMIPHIQAPEAIETCSHEQNNMKNPFNANLMEISRQDVEKNIKKRKQKIKEDFICVSCQSTEKNKLVTCYICKKKKCKSCIEKEKESRPLPIKKREQSSYICIKCFENETSKNRKKTNQEGIDYSNLSGIPLQNPQTFHKKRGRTSEKTPSQLQTLDLLQNDNEVLDLDMLHNCVTPPSEFLEDDTPKRPMKVYKHQKIFGRRRRRNIEKNQLDKTCHQCLKSNPFVEYFKCAKIECTNYYCEKCIKKYPKDKFRICFACQRTCKCSSCKAEMRRTKGLNHIEIDLEKLESKTNLVKIDDFVIVENDAPENESLGEEIKEDDSKMRQNPETRAIKLTENISKKVETDIYTEKKKLLICQICKSYKEEGMLFFKTLEELVMYIKHYFEEISANASSLDQFTKSKKDFKEYCLNRQKNEKMKDSVFHSARCICKECFSNELHDKNGGFYTLFRILSTGSNYQSAGSGNINKNLFEKSMIEGISTIPLPSIDQSKISEALQGNCLIKKEKKTFRKMRNRAAEKLKHSDELNSKNHQLSEMENTNEVKENEKEKPIPLNSTGQNINGSSSIIQGSNIIIPSSNPFLPGSFLNSIPLRQSELQQIQTNSWETNPELTIRSDQPQVSANDSSTYFKKEILQNPDALNVTNIIMNIEQNKGNPNYHISMTKVLEELKSQFFSIQYYSLIQKLFISYIFKHMEMFTDNITKNQVLAEFVLNNLVSTMSKNADDPENAQLIKDILDQLGMLKTINNKALTLTNALNTNFDELKNNGYKIFKVIDPMEQSGLNNLSNENEMGKLIESIQNLASVGKGGIQNTSQDGTSSSFSIENMVNNINKMKNMLNNMNATKSGNTAASTSNPQANSNSANLTRTSHVNVNSSSTGVTKSEVSQNNMSSNSNQLATVVPSNHGSLPLPTVKSSMIPSATGTSNTKKEIINNPIPKITNTNTSAAVNQSIFNNLKSSSAIKSSLFVTPSNINTEQKTGNKTHSDAQIINFNSNSSPNRFPSQPNMDNANMNNLLKIMGILQNQNPNLLQNLFLNNSLYGGMLPPQLSLNPLLGYPGLGGMPQISGNDFLSSILMGAKMNCPGIGSMNQFVNQLLNMMNTINSNTNTGNLLLETNQNSQNHLTGEGNQRGNNNSTQEKKEEKSEERETKMK